MVLELGDVLVQGGGVRPILLQDHPLGGEPGDDSASNISLFEGFVVFGYEV